jgi:hypothetical protein
MDEWPQFDRSHEVAWFWDIFEEMDTFAVAIQWTSVVPKFPVSHTCFTAFALPAYTSKEEMREKIRIAIENGSRFGIANISTSLPSLQLQKQEMSSLKE